MAVNVAQITLYINQNMTLC